MAGFNVLRDIGDKGLRVLPVSSLTASVGDLLDLAVGSATWAKVTSSSVHFTRKAIVMQAITSASTVLAYELDGSEDVEVQSANTANTAHNGDRMLATDENTINNTGTDNTSKEAIFLQIGAGRNTTTIIGRVMVGSGVNPAAA